MRGSQQRAENMLTWTTFQTRQEEMCKDLRGQISHRSPLNDELTSNSDLLGLI